MSWQLLTAVSVITFSVSVLLRRLLIHKDQSNPYAYVIVFQGLVGIITGVYALINGFQMPDARYWPAMVITSVLYAAAHVVSTGALKLVEASVFSVLYATSAIWTMVVGLLLFSDGITTAQLLGVLLVFVSVGVLVERKKSWKLDRGIVLGLLTGLLFGVATASWAYVGRHADVPSWTALSFLGPALTVLLIKPKAVAHIKPFLRGTMFTRMVLLGGIFSVSALTSLFAYRDGNVSLVAALQQTGIIITTLLAIIFLNERQNLLRKGLSAAICFIAVLLIV
jgi:drug/metabolite transporter (DMT)-like permease